MYLVDVETRYSDIGDMLAHGVNVADAIIGASGLQLIRIGPFCPPISLPGHEVVVTTEWRTHFEESGLQARCKFTPVDIHKVLHVNWDGMPETLGDWEERQEWQSYVTDVVEPEDILFLGTHSTESCRCDWTALASKATSVRRDLL